jgi:hypothetical protein
MGHLLKIWLFLALLISAAAILPIEAVRVSDHSKSDPEIPHKESTAAAHRHSTVSKYSHPSRHPTYITVFEMLLYVLNSIPIAVVIVVSVFTVNILMLSTLLSILLISILFVKYLPHGVPSSLENFTHSYCPNIQLLLDLYHPFSTFCYGGFALAWLVPRYFSLIDTRLAKVQLPAFMSKFITPEDTRPTIYFWIGSILTILISKYVVIAYDYMVHVIFLCMSTVELKELYLHY